MEVDCFRPKIAATTHGQVQCTHAESLRIPWSHASQLFLHLGGNRQLQDRLMGASHEKPGSHTAPAGSQPPGRAWLWHGGDHRAGQQGAAQEASLVGWLWGNMAKNGICGGCGHGKPNVPLRTMPFQSKVFIFLWPDC